MITIPREQCHPPYPTFGHKLEISNQILQFFLLFIFVMCPQICRLSLLTSLLHIFHRNSTIQFLMCFPLFLLMENYSMIFYPTLIFLQKMYSLPKFIISLIITYSNPLNDISDNSLHYYRQSIAYRTYLLFMYSSNKDVFSNI